MAFCKTINNFVERQGKSGSRIVSGHVSESSLNISGCLINHDALNAIPVELITDRRGNAKVNSSFRYISDVKMISSCAYMHKISFYSGTWDACDSEVSFCKVINNLVEFHFEILSSMSRSNIRSRTQ